MSGKKMKWLLGSLALLTLPVGAIACGDTEETASSQPTTRQAAATTSPAALPSTNIYDAIAANLPGIVQQHMEAGTDPNRDPVPKGFPFEGAYPLHIAVITGNKEIAQILLDSGADINLESANKDQSTPLSWAAFFLQTDMIPIIVQSGALINHIDANNATPLDTAVFSRMMNLTDKDIVKQADKTIVLLKDLGGRLASELQK